MRRRRFPLLGAPGPALAAALARDAVLAPAAAALASRSGPLDRGPLARAKAQR